MGASEDYQNFYMETEYCASGDLSHCLWPNKSNNYYEKIIKAVSTELLLGLKTLHSNGIIHCNLKPSNILIDEFGNVKICDFKKALRVNTMTINDIKKNKTAMTPCYTAPELFREDGAYNFKTDLWALGCIMYEMAVGQVPFFDETVGKLIEKILTEEVNFNKKQLTLYSNEFLEVIKKLLEKDSVDRPGWGEIEKMPFWEFDSVIGGEEINHQNVPEMNTSLLNNSNSTKHNDIRKTKSSGHSSHSQPQSSNSQASSLLVYNSQVSQIQPGNTRQNSNNIITKNLQGKVASEMEIISNDNDEDYSGVDKNNTPTKDDIETTDREFNFQGKENNSVHDENDSSTSSYPQQRKGSKSKPASGQKNLNSLDISVLNVSKIMIRDKRATKNSINDMALSLAKPDDLPQIQSIMIHNSDRIVKPIIGNKTIETQKPTTYNSSKLGFNPVFKIDKIKELILTDSTEQLEKYLLNIYTLFDTYSSRKAYDLLLNLLNYFETIIMSKEVANNIINTSFMKMFINFLDINDDNIRIRACSIIAYLIRYATSMDVSLDKYNITEKFISFISDGNVELNRKAIATLGEYLFFVATQAEGDDDENLNLNSTTNTWNISQDSLTALLYALNHSDEIVKFYALKTIENIVTLTNVSKVYFCSNDDYIKKIIDIYNDVCENNEIKTSALSTISHLVRHEPNLLKVFIDKVDSVGSLLENENSKNQQYMINILLFGVALDANNKEVIKMDEILPVLIYLLESSNSVIKSKIIIFLSLTFSDIYLIIKFGEKVLSLMKKLRKEKEKFYYYVKIFECYMVNYCKSISKYFSTLLSGNYNLSTSNQTSEIISILNSFNILGSYMKISYALYKPDFLENLIKIIYTNSQNENVLKLTFDVVKGFSENAYSVEENSDYVISKMLINVLNSTSKISVQFKRFPLNIAANILTTLLDDDKLYSSTVLELNKTSAINSLIITILPKITEMLKSEDTIDDALSFLALIIERNSAFISFYRSVGIIDIVFSLMNRGDYYANLNLIKILIKLIESNDTSFNDIIQLNLIDKVNYLISKDNTEDLSIYTEYVVEMFYDLLFKINEMKKQKFSSSKIDKEDYKKNFTSKIEKIAINFKLCIKLLGCENVNIQEKSCVCLIFLMQFFHEGYVESVGVNVRFGSEDVPDLLKGLDSSCKKIHKKMIKIFKWIIEYQDDAAKVLNPYASYIQIYVEKIRDTSDDADVVNVAVKFLNSDLKKISGK